MGEEGRAESVRGAWGMRSRDQRAHGAPVCTNRMQQARSTPSLSQVPNVFRNEFTLMDINDEGFVSGAVELGGSAAAWHADQGLLAICSRSAARGRPVRQTLALSCGGCRFGLAQVTLLKEDGSTREDLTLPKGTDEADKLAEQLKSDFNDGKEIVVTVLKVRRGQRVPIAADCPIAADSSGRTAEPSRVRGGRTDSDGPTHLRCTLRRPWVTR